MYGWVYFKIEDCKGCVLYCSAECDDDGDFSNFDNLVEKVEDLGIPNYVWDGEMLYDAGSCDA
jgi:hypothetical protein